MANVFQPAMIFCKRSGNASSYPIQPVLAEVAYTDQAQTRHEAYSIFAIERDSGQAAMLDLTGNFNSRQNRPHCRRRRFFCNRYRVTRYGNGRMAAR